MKTLFKLTAGLLATVIFTLVSCQKDQTPSKKKKTAGGYFEVNIHGNNSPKFNAEGGCGTVHAIYTPLDQESGTRSILIQGKDGNQLLTLMVYFKGRFPANPTFSLKDNDETDNWGLAGYIPNVNDPTSNFSSVENESGKITITEYDKESETLSGSFNFVLQRTDGVETSAGNTLSFTGTFSNVPINDFSDPNYPKGPCFNTKGNDLGTGPENPDANNGGNNNGGNNNGGNNNGGNNNGGNNAGGINNGGNIDGGNNNGGNNNGGNNTGGNNNGGSQQNTVQVTFTNPAFTDITVTCDGETKIAPSGGSCTFNKKPNSSITYEAETSGQTSDGSIVGLKITWPSKTLQVSPAGNNTVLNVGSNFFFLMVTNNSGRETAKVYVNYGLQSQTLEYLDIPADGDLIGLGYYKAYSNSTLRIETPAGSSGSYFYWSFNSLNLSFTENQSVNVVID